MATLKLDLEGKAVFLKNVVFDAEQAYDGLLLEASGTLEIVPINNAAAVVVDLDKGWHPLAFKQVNAAGTTLAATQIWGALGKGSV